MAEMLSVPMELVPPFVRPFVGAMLDDGFWMGMAAPRTGRAS
jgi:hypothetical protein